MNTESLSRRIAALLGSSQPTPAAVEPGTYHFQDLTGDVVTRFHLRVDPDGGGLLMANAAEAAHLSDVGVLMAHGILSRQSDETIMAQVQNRFEGVSPGTVRDDLDQVHALIADLSTPDDNYPVSNLADPEMSSWSRALSAPTEADVDQCDPETAREMLMTLWKVGVPHVTWVVNPERDVAEIVRLVELAGDIGMVCGVRTVASWLGDDTVEKAAEAGLDHIDIVYADNDASAHDAVAGDGDRERVTQILEQCRQMEFAAVAVVPIFSGNVDDLAEIIFGGRQEGISNMSFFAMVCPDDDTDCVQAGGVKAKELHQVAAVIEDATLEVQGRYLWLPPVRYDPAVDIREQIRRGPRTAGDLSVRVDGDGEVYAPRGPLKSAGNLLEDKWETIWDDEAFARYRQRLTRPQECIECRELPICAADCPADPKAWSDPTKVGEDK